MTADPGSDIILKILSGRHAGAGVRLFDGEYRVGRADDCDIILSDDTVSDCHVLLAVTGSEVRIQAMTDPVFIDATPVKDERPLQPLQVITAGSVHMAVGPDASDWSHLTLPDLNSLNIEDDEEKEIDPETEEVPEPDIDKPNPEDQQHHGQQLQAASNAAAPVPPKPDNRSWIGKAAACAVAALVIILAGGLWLLNSGDPAQTTQNTMSADRIKALLSPEQIQQLTITKNSTGLFTISGFVRSEENRKKIGQMIREKQVPAAVRIYSGETMAADCNEFLKRYKQQIKAEYDGSGGIILRGSSNTPDLIKQAIASMKQDFSAILNISDQIVYETTVQSQSNQNKAVATTVIQPASGTGTINKTPSKQTTPGVHLPIVSVSMGDEPSLVLDNGRRYFEGSLVTKGYSITRIFSDRIILTKEKQQIIYKLGGQ